MFSPRARRIGHARGGGLGGKADTAGANTSAKGAKLIRNCGIEDGSAVGFFDDQGAQAPGRNQRHESTVDIFECLGMLDAFRQLVKEGRECLAPAGEVRSEEAVDKHNERTGGTRWSLLRPWPSSTVGAGRAPGGKHHGTGRGGARWPAAATRA